MLKKYLKIEYFYLLLILVHGPLFKLIFKINGSGAATLAFTVYIFIHSIRRVGFSRIFLKRPVVIWAIWAIYAFINSLINGHTGEDMANYIFFTLLAVPVIMMNLIVVLYVKDRRRLLNVLITGMFLGIMSIVVFNQSAAFDDGRYGGEINSNTVGIMSVVLLMFWYLKYLYKDISLKYVLLLSIPLALLIVLTGSKTAFGGLFLLILSHFIVNRSKNLIKSIIKFSIAGIFLFIVMSYVLNYTVIGERISTASNALEETELDTGSVILNKFGDRGVFYAWGWQVFKERPILGVGLGNFRDFNEIDAPQHVEYMIQLSELGIIGFFLFFLFYYSIFKKLKQKKVDSKNQKLKEIYFAYVIIILAMVTATRMYNQWYMYSIIGLVIGFIENKRMYKVVKITSL